MDLTKVPESTGQDRKTAGGHLLPLDGVRGLAILMVIGSHAFESNYESGRGLVLFIGTFLHYGYLGVDLFFVLSGFLITGILFDSLKDDGYFRKFYARRALRIFPLYYGVLVVCLLLTYPLHLQWKGMGWLLLFYLQNLRPMQIMTFSAGSWVALFHFWSLAVEEQFYLVWPAVVFLVRSKRRLLIVTLAGSAGALLLRVGLLLGGASPFAMHVTMVCRADSLLLGGAFAMLYRSRAWMRVERVAPWGFVGAAGMMVASILLLEPKLAAYPKWNILWMAGCRYTVLAVGFSFLLAWSLREGSVCKRFFEVRWLRFLGKYSYGLYVLHVLVLAALNLPLRAELLQLTHSKLIAVVGAGLTSLALSILAAYGSYHVYERPFLRLKHHFDYSRRALNHGSPEDA